MRAFAFIRRLLAGRVLNGCDTAGAPHVVVVNESFVRRYSPNESAVGKRILVGKILPSRRGLGPETAWEIQLSPDLDLVVAYSAPGIRSGEQER